MPKKKKTQGLLGNTAGANPPSLAPIPCAESFCVCLAEPESQGCAVHRTHPKLRLDVAATVAAITECLYCDGTGECEDCDGLGQHLCERGNCYESHDCGTCGGTGDCRTCKPRYPRVRQRSWDEKYLSWAFDAYVPPPERPWEVEQP